MSEYFARSLAQLERAFPQSVEFHEYCIWAPRSVVFSYLRSAKEELHGDKNWEKLRGDLKNFIDTLNIQSSFPNPENSLTFNRGELLLLTQVCTDEIGVTFDHIIPVLLGRLFKLDVEIIVRQGYLEHWQSMTVEQQLTQLDWYYSSIDDLVLREQLRKKVMEWMTELSAHTDFPTSPSSPARHDT